MKVRNIIYAIVVILFASCAAKPGDITKITGVVNDATVDSVNVGFPAQQIDTTLEIKNGKFEIEVPADLQNYGMILFMSEGEYKYGTYLISDGTGIKVTLENDDINVVSSIDYIQNRYCKYIADIEGIYESESETKEADMENLWIETVKENPDNAIATLIVSDAMYDLSPEKMLEVISFIQEPVKSQEFISKREKEANAQLNTQPGMKFVDFTVNHVYGYDKSADPQPLTKEVKFSDYVGKGKYVLVDFWSPWCGPCRREVPNIAKVYADYKEKGLEVLSVAVWERKPQSHTMEVAAQLEMDWHHINNAQREPTEIYGIGGIPHLMLIGPDGTILKRGFYGLEGIQEAVSEYIK